MTGQLHTAHPRQLHTAHPRQLHTAHSRQWAQYSRENLSQKYTDRQVVPQTTIQFQTRMLTWYMHTTCRSRVWTHSHHW